MSAPATKMDQETVKRVDAMVRLGSALSKLGDEVQDYMTRTKESNAESAPKADRDGR